MKKFIFVLFVLLFPFSIAAQTCVEKGYIANENELTTHFRNRDKIYVKNAIPSYPSLVQTMRAFYFEKNKMLAQQGQCGIEIIADWRHANAYIYPYVTFRKLDSFRYQDWDRKKQAKYNWINIAIDVGADIVASSVNNWRVRSTINRVRHNTRNMLRVPVYTIQEESYEVVFQKRIVANDDKTILQENLGVVQFTLQRVQGQNVYIIKDVFPAGILDEGVNYGPNWKQIAAMAAFADAENKSKPFNHIRGH